MQLHCHLTVPLFFFYIQKTEHYRVLQRNAVFYKNGRSDMYCLFIIFILDFTVESHPCYCRNMNRKWYLSKKSVFLYYHTFISRSNPDAVNTKDMILSLCGLHSWVILLFLCWLKDAHGTLLAIESLNTTQITVFAAHCGTTVTLFCSWISRDDSIEHTYSHECIAIQMSSDLSGIK